MPKSKAQSGSASFPKIDANPTKTFFISMLVRDINLLDAIVDLVDNSVDGARSLRPAKEGAQVDRYKGLAVELTVNSTEFCIDDNCGGIEADHAQKYVFNFGRKESYPAVEGSVGQFGVGMKRALFKIGNHFRIESRSKSSSFVVDVDVPKWQRGTENPWEFEFEDYVPQIQPSVRPADRFTNIRVDNLHPSVATQFGLGQVVSQLAVMLGQQHQASLEQGLDILINGNSVARRTPALLKSSDIIPLHANFPVEAGGATVDVEIFAGLSDSGERELAGWYIYCNDRLVVGADKSELTGWGRAAGGTLPEYHPQFRRFRGYAFMSAEDAGVLPWNTTKTSVDSNSPVYQKVLGRMIVAMQQVLAVITQADNELDSHPRGGGPLNKAIAAAQSVALSQVSASDRFEVKVKAATKQKSTTTVSYSVDVDRLEEVKDALGVTSGKQAGLATFDYYYEAVIE